MLDNIAGISGIAMGCLFLWNSTKASEFDPHPKSFCCMNLLFAAVLIFVGAMHFV